MMDRPELEDRIRTALATHADDLEPSAELYRRARRRAARRTWGRRGWQAVAAVAAGTAVVVGANLLQPPPAVEIDPFGSPTGPADARTGLPEDTRTPAATSSPRVPTADATAATSGHDLVGAAATTVVATDGERILQLDPTSGETIAELPAFADFGEGAWVGDVAVRPGSGATITVATVIGLEGQSWEVEVSTFRDGRRTGRYRAPVPAAPMGDATDRHPPTVTWSPDGNHLAWIAVDADGGATATVLDWTAARARPDDPEVVRSVRKWMFEDGASLRAQGWTGSPATTSHLWVTSVDGGPLAALELEACTAPDCAPFAGTWTDEAGLQGRSVADVTHPRGETRLALVPTGTEPAEDGPETLLLLYEPNAGPPEGVLWLPRDLGRGPVIAPWLAADGDLVAVGDGGEPLVDDSRAWLLRTTGRAADTGVEDPLEVDQDAAIRLPDEVTTVDIGWAE